MVQTKHAIEQILAGHGIRPLKRFGQNFLIDGNLMRRLVAAAEISPQDVVLEVGPGTGSLTEELLAQCAHVVAAEVDHTLQAVCQSRFAESGKFTLVCGDALARKSVIAPALREAMEDQHQRFGGRLMLVANLPYQIATALVIDLLMTVPQMSRLCFTVQAEVADRLLASPGGKDYGPVSIIVQTLATGRRIAKVPPTAFWPAPLVHSAMLRLDRLVPEPVSAGVLQRMTSVVHHCFSHRRKTMLSNLRTCLDATQLAMVSAAGRWDLSARPEAWSVDQWVEIARLLAGDDGQG